MIIHKHYAPKFYADMSIILSDVIKYDRICNCCGSMFKNDSIVCGVNIMEHEDTLKHVESINLGGGNILNVGLKYE